MPKKESYEELLNKLQDVLAKLENNELNLDQSMKSYEEGVNLINKLYKTLNELEGKITVVNNQKEEENFEE